MIVFRNPEGEDVEDARDAEAALAESGEPVLAEELWAELGLVPHEEIVRRYT